MIEALASALLVMAASQTAAAEPPPGLQFGFWRMVAFRARARELRCASGDLDQTFEGLRRQLVARYGRDAFKIPDIPRSGPGECSIALSVYRVNLADWQREVAAALGSRSNEAVQR